jgi:hypothetical protein
LESSTTPLSSNPVTKCYYTNGARYDEDISQNTNDKGQVIWATSVAYAALRAYYTTFPGDRTFASLTSDIMTINVH